MTMFSSLIPFHEYHLNTVQCRCKINSSHTSSVQVAIGGSAMSTRRHRQVVKMLIVVLVLFVVCRGPWHFADLIIDSVIEDDDDESNIGLMAVRQLSTILVFFNSWMTPVIYALFNKRIRNQVTEDSRLRVRSLKMRLCDISSVTYRNRLAYWRPAQNTYSNLKLCGESHITYQFIISSGFPPTNPKIALK